MLRLLQQPLDKVILAKLIDQSFRSANPRRVADQAYHLLSNDGIPEFFLWWEKLLLHLFVTLGRRQPALSVPRILAHIRRSAGRMIIAGETGPLHNHLKIRKSQKSGSTSTIWVKRSWAKRKPNAGWPNISPIWKIPWLSISPLRYPPSFPSSTPLLLNIARASSVNDSVRCIAKPWNSASNMLMEA